MPPAIKVQAEIKVLLELGINHVTLKKNAKMVYHNKFNLLQAVEAPSIKAIRLNHKSKLTGPKNGKYP